MKLKSDAYEKKFHAHKIIFCAHETGVNKIGPRESAKEY